MTDGGSWSLDDYVEVAERIALFHERYPEGTLQAAQPWEIRQVGDKQFIIYYAKAYRSPNDQRPGEGTAWEPFPGPTKYTRDSELMNAETAAWGRALVAVGIASKKVASREEVQARQPAEKAAEKAADGYGEVPKHRRPSDAQKHRIQSLVKEHGVARVELDSILDQWGLHVAEGWVDRLTPGREGTASRLIDILSKLEKPQVDA